MIMGEMRPGGSAAAVVLPYGAPGALAQVGPPALPVLFTARVFFEPEGLRRTQLRNVLPRAPRLCHDSRFTVAAPLALGGGVETQSVESLSHAPPAPRQ